MDDIRIVPSEERHAEGLRSAYEDICKERVYFSVLQAPPLEAVVRHMQTLRQTGGVQYVAVAASDRVVGWCDVTRNARGIESHAGSLGMGLLREYRGQGVGRRLAEAALRDAVALGFERVELGVYASNEAAVALYKRLGFVTEGVKRRARKLDGEFTDKLMMAVLFN